MTTVSVIVTTYNRPDALAKVLAALLCQSVKPLEVLLADDGSGEATRQCVQVWQAQAPFPIWHIWHADDGFRAAAIRNRAAARAQGDYLVFLDGDSIPFADFVLRHVSLAEQGYFVTGNRVLLAAKMTQQVLENAADPLHWSPARWFAARGQGLVNRLLPLLRLPDGAWRKRRQKAWRGARSCNMAIWRRDFVQVNGFDESYAGWGHEDADLAMRLIRAGVLRKDGRYALPVLHLWHAENPRQLEAANRERLQDVIDGKRPIRATLGMDQYRAN
ncbi:MAG: glycosyl transferase family 2 [Gammaproteobacteria bacterium 28-57-27]|nr:MAG: glycosyl transferase family 2 [Gammaproteobacteria bacterium 28-57-27]